MSHGLLQLPADLRCPRCRSRTGIEVRPEIRELARALPPAEPFQRARCYTCKAHLVFTAGDIARAA